MSRYRYRVWLEVCLCVAVALLAVAGTVLWVVYVVTSRGEPVPPAGLEMLNLERTDRGLAPISAMEHDGLVWQYRAQIKDIALPAAAVGAGVEVLALAVLVWALLGRQRRWVCRRCGYSTRGNVSGRCPECGMPIQGQVDARRRETARRQRGT